MKLDLFGKGLTILLVILASNTALLSCKPDGKQQIQGDWYSFDKDSAYFELYINDTMIVLNQFQNGPVGYDYAVEGNKLIVSNAAGMERIWRVAEIRSETMKLSDSLESLHYSRLKLSKSFFNSLADSLSFREFSENFKTRYSLHSNK